MFGDWNFKNKVITEFENLKSEPDISLSFEDKTSFLKGIENIIKSYNTLEQFRDQLTKNRRLIDNKIREIDGLNYEIGDFNKTWSGQVNKDLIHNLSLNLDSERKKLAKLLYINKFLEKIVPPLIIEGDVSLVPGTVQHNPAGKYDRENYDGGRKTKRRNKKHKKSNRRLHKKTNRRLHKKSNRRTRR